MANSLTCEHGIWPDRAGGHHCATMPATLPPQQMFEARASVKPQHRFEPDGMGLNHWADIIHEWAERKGWWPGEGRNLYEIIALVHSELSEALEHLREGNFGLVLNAVLWHTGASDCLCGGGCKRGKPDGFAIELVDAIIRILDVMKYIDADPDDLISLKMAYNETRPYRHGGKRA